MVSRETIAKHTTLVVHSICIFLMGTADTHSFLAININSVFSLQEKRPKVFLQDRHHYSLAHHNLVTGSTFCGVVHGWPRLRVEWAGFQSRHIQNSGIPNPSPYHNKLLISTFHHVTYNFDGPGSINTSVIIWFILVLLIGTTLILMTIQCGWKLLRSF